MCWYSAEHAGHRLDAEAGQRLVTRKVHGSTWAVQEADLENLQPTPVCLVDQTKVLFRFSEDEQAGLAAPLECKAVFRMLTKPKRDVFQLSDGRELAVNSLPARLVFDILEIPGEEERSALLKDDSEERDEPEPATKRESLLDRVLTFF